MLPPLRGLKSLTVAIRISGLAAHRAIVVGWLEMGWLFEDIQERSCAMDSVAIFARSSRSTVRCAIVNAIFNLSAAPFIVIKGFARLNSTPNVI